eukprot:1351518-Amorphochlora_amoeboformis.AAC.1
MEQNSNHYSKFSTIPKGNTPMHLAIPFLSDTSGRSVNWESGRYERGEKEGMKGKGKGKGKEIGCQESEKALTDEKRIYIYIHTVETT